MYKVAIIGGAGVVGSAYVKFFEKHCALRIYDPNYPQSNTKESVNKCQYALICVPTNMKEDGSADTSIVEDTLKWLKVKNVMIKSTIPPGTTKALEERFSRELVFSPEYIGESKYYTPPRYLHPTDVEKHNFIILGGKNTKPWLKLFKTIMGPDAHYLQTDSTTAELVKYGENSWGATKVTFFNEFYNICETFGIDFDEWRELLLHDSRVERMHTQVFEDNRGFGGKCFPKDVNAIIKKTKEAGYNPELLEQLLKCNDKFKGGDK